jgi:hypothetical protein
MMACEALIFVSSAIKMGHINLRRTLRNSERQFSVSTHISDFNIADASNELKRFGDKSVSHPKLPPFAQNGPR